MKPRIMQYFLSVPCRTSGRLSLQSSAQTTSTYSRSIPRLAKPIASFHSSIAGLRYIRHSLAALFIPAVILAGSALLPWPDTGLDKTDRALMVMHAEDKVISHPSLFDSPRYEGITALGTPRLTDGQAHAALIALA